MTMQDELMSHDEALAALDKARRELASEVKRREGIEDELHEERLAHTAAVTRAEESERQWSDDEREVQASCAGWKARAEQAEKERDALLKERDEAIATRTQLLKDWQAYKTHKDAWCTDLEAARDEAFATVRRTLTNESVSPEDKAWGALSLLERRMGAMAAFARSPTDGISLPFREAMRMAKAEALRLLTEAPPVFTLEEVEKALADPENGVDTPTQQCVRDSLLLRRR